MVSLDPSPAAALALVGGDLALDFANTSSGRGSSAPREHLRRPEHVVEWAAHARIVSPEDAERLMRLLAEDEALATRLLDEALALREAIYALGAALAAVQPAPEASVQNLTETHARALAHARLTPLGHNFGWSWSAQQNPVATQEPGGNGHRNTL